MARKYMMTAKRRAALRKAQLASARKRRRNRRIDKKIGRVTRRTDRRTEKLNRKILRGIYTHSTEGGVYYTARAAKTYNKAVKIRNRGINKVNRLKARKKR